MSEFFVFSFENTNLTQEIGFEPMTFLRTEDLGSSALTTRPFPLFVNVGSINVIDLSKNHHGEVFTRFSYRKWGSNPRVLTNRRS